jgi:hypothetical protein
MKSFNKTLQWKEESVNTETGEVVQSTKSVSIKVNTDNFYFTFIESIGYLIGISNGTELQILSLLCINAEYNKGTCLLTSQRRREFCNALSITPNTFGVCLSRLVKKGVIKNVNGNIEINPICFWKGSIEERNKLLKDKGLDLNIKFKGE